ncbi:MAG: flagellar biosynthesis protein FliQ [Alphaproteobacteria bacterium]|nr:flagellar biosynthesis protein FliQ [Alphaproteobacteria bacterium]
MTQLEIIEISRQSIWVLLKVSAPVLIIALIVGFSVSLLQALTQMQEMTLSFVPKIILIFLSLILLMPYMISTLKEYTEHLYALILKSS